MSGINPFITILVAAWLVGFGVAGAGLAVRRRRRPETWVLLGAILGPAALALLQLAPPGRCWKCEAPTEGWQVWCAWCGEDVREPVRKPAPEPVRGIPTEEGRVHGGLTVIDGKAPGPLARTVGARSATGLGASPRSASLSHPPEAPVRGLASQLPAERRLDFPRAPSVDPVVAARARAAATIETAPDPVHRLKARLGRSGQLATAETMPAPAVVAEPRTIVLASAIYVTGSRGLLAGSRYGIAVHGDVLRILGPVDVDPAAVTMVHTLRGLDATGIQGRLIVTAGGRRDGLALVFMSIAGGSAEAIADALVAAADEQGMRPR